MLPDALLAFAENAPPPPGPPQGSDSDEAAFARLRWLAVPGLEASSGGPYRVLDCRPLSLSMTSTTADATIAATFARLRGDDGRRLAGVKVQDALRAASDIALPGFDVATRGDGPIFRAPEMEWKWDVTLVDEHLLFSRSWSGDLHARARVLPADGGARIVDVEVTHKLGEGDPRAALALVEYLVRVYVLAKVAPHPLPVGSPTSTTRDAFLYSWSLHGRAAFFAAPLAGLPLAPSSSLGM